MIDRGPGVWRPNMEMRAGKQILHGCKGRELDGGKSGYLMGSELGEGEWLVM